MNNMKFVEQLTANLITNYTDAGTYTCGEKS